MKSEYQNKKDDLILNKIEQQLNKENYWLELSDKIDDHLEKIRENNKKIG